MGEVATRADRLGAAPQPPERRHDDGEPRHNRGCSVGRHGNRPGGDPKRVHRFDAGGRAFAQQRDCCGGQGAPGGEIAAESLELVSGRQIAVPEQPGGFLERRVFGQLAYGEPGDDQLAALAIDLTEMRRRGDDSVQSAVDHGRNVAPLYDRVNVDCRINMAADRPWMSAAEAASVLRVSRATLYAYVSRDTSARGRCQARRESAAIPVMTSSGCDEGRRSVAIRTRRPPARCSGACRCWSRRSR